MVLNELLALKIPTRSLPSRNSSHDQPLADRHPPRLPKFGDLGRPAARRSSSASGRGLAYVATMKLLSIGPIVGANFYSFDGAGGRTQAGRWWGTEARGDGRSTPRGASTAPSRWSSSGVSVPGMIEHAVRMAPKGSRILVVGTCMQEDHIRPILSIGEELSLQFVLGSPRRIGPRRSSDLATSAGRPLLVIRDQHRHRSTAYPASVRRLRQPKGARRVPRPTMTRTRSPHPPRGEVRDHRSVRNQVAALGRPSRTVGDVQPDGVDFLQWAE